MSRIFRPPRLFTPDGTLRELRVQKRRGLLEASETGDEHSRPLVRSSTVQTASDTAVEDDDPTRWVVAHRRQWRRRSPRSRTPRSNRPRRQRQRQQWRATRHRIRYPWRGTWIRSSPCSMPGARVSSPALTTRRGPSTWRRTSNLTRRRRLAFTPFSRRMRATPASKR